MTDTLDMIPVRVRSEPLTYERHAPVSYFRDLVIADRDRDAAARLSRHAGEMRSLIERRNREGFRALDALAAEYRVTPGAIAQGEGGYFAPPLWLLDKFATAPRTGRILGSLIPSFPLPHGVHSVNVPRLTTGTSAAGQVDNNPAANQDVVDAAVDGTVVTIAGVSDWALQALEQSPPGAHLDTMVFQDLAEAFDYSYEQQLIYGTGSNSATSSTGQLLGVTQVSGISTVTFTQASPTLSLMYPFLGQTAAQVGDKRKKPHECWLMTTSRWAWIATSEDTQNRPITPPDTSDPPPLLADGPGSAPGAIGALAGRWPVFLDDAVPATFSGASTVGTPGGGTQDIIIALRPTDLMLFESSPTTMVSREPLSGSMGARFVYRARVAALTARYPTGIGVLVGTGMAVQAGF